MKNVLALCLPLFLIACGGSPTSPTPVAPGAALDGVWRITYRITECGGERHCVLFIGQTREAFLRLVRSGETFEGVFRIAGEVVDVRGTLAADGSLALTGVRPPVMASDLEVTVPRLLIRESGPGLTGEFEYTVRGTPMGNFFGNARQAAVVVSAERVRTARPRDLVRFGGRWQGFFAVRACDATGWPWCYPYEEERLQRFELMLRQSGDRVEGELILPPVTLAVSGTVVGDSLDLEGSTDRIISGGREVARITSWSARRDPAGRMTGTFAFDLEWIWSDPSTGTYATRYRRVELVSVVLTD